MKSLPEEIKILKRIKEKLDILMSDRCTPVEIRSNDLYECIIRDEQLGIYFPDQKTFNRFLRKQHNNGLLKQIITNYRVDTSNHRFYQWYFHRDVHKNAKSRKGIEIHSNSSKLKFFSRDLNVLAADGIKLRSLQEKEIYDKLITYSYLKISYEFPICRHHGTKYADFKIFNQVSQKTWYWEHFGMTNSQDYLDTMTEKIEWYKTNGFKTIEDGGNLIFTIYSNMKTFQRDVDRYIHLIETECI